ncbi:hypothetical protein Mapa_012493 [Marchantia paleacea]|nr:hypothetical protein Mapa_012493 [Marchantia paleacea]
MEKHGIVPFTLYIECWMDLNREPSALVPFNTYVEIRTISQHKRMWSDCIVRNYGEEYYNMYGDG